MEIVADKSVNSHPSQPLNLTTRPIVAKFARDPLTIDICASSAAEVRVNFRARIKRSVSLEVLKRCVDFLSIEGPSPLIDRGPTTWLPHMVSV